MKRTIASAALAIALVAAGAYAANPKAPAKAAPPASPETVSISSMSAWYGPVTFTHAKHASLAGDCTSCHHQSDGEPVACVTCHQAQVDPGSPSAVTLKLAYHERCVGCHKAAGSGPTGCNDCHTKNPKGPAPAPTDKK
jgi:hypothetical protein